MCLIAFHIWSHKTLTLRSVSFPGSLLSKRNTCGVPKSAGDSKFKYSFEYGASYVDFLLILRPNRKCVKHASGQCQGVKILSTHTTHNTKRRSDQMRRCGGDRKKCFYLVFNFGVFCYLSFSLILQGTNCVRNWLIIEFFTLFFVRLNNILGRFPKNDFWSSEEVGYGRCRVKGLGPFVVCCPAV